MDSVPEAKKLLLNGATVYCPNPECPKAVVRNHRICHCKTGFRRVCETCKKSLSLKSWSGHPCNRPAPSAVEQVAPKNPVKNKGNKTEAAVSPKHDAETSPFTPFVPDGAEKHDWPVAPEEQVWNQNSVYRCKLLWQDPATHLRADQMFNFDRDTIPCQTCGRCDGASQSVYCLDPPCKARLHIGACMSADNLLPYGCHWFCVACRQSCPELTQIMNNERAIVFTAQFERAIESARQTRRERQTRGIMDNTQSLVQWIDD